MDLVELEFRDYASFAECRVPILPGVTLLVGRNNVGKTAILRGVSVLNLVIHSSQPFSPELFGYLPQRAGTPPFVQLTVSFRLEGADEEVLGTPNQWRDFIQTRNVVLAFQVLVGQSSGVFFGACTLSTADKQVDLLGYTGPTGPSLRRFKYDRNFQPLPQTLNVSLGMLHAMEQRQYIQPLPGDLAAGFSALKPVRMIEAHRTVRSQIPLATADALSSNAEFLATFLKTLQGRNRRQFEEIESALTSIFPEFEYVNAEDSGNMVFLTFTQRATGKNIPITHCGTGVEQILTLATFVVTSPPGTIICVDEPHSYLHPAAERSLMDFLQRHSEHRYLIATHSPVILNSVSPDRVLNVTLNESGRGVVTRSAVPEVLRSLGYRNSDFLFSDRLIFVEGPSDQAIVPLLLSRIGRISPIQIEGTGFPNLGGTPSGTRRAKTLQTTILKYEKVLAEVGQAHLPRMYLFDGDFTPADRSLLQGTTFGGAAIPVSFLPAREIENYLLIPEAIEAVLRDELSVEGGDKIPSAADVQKRLAALLSDERLYPDGNVASGAVGVKGSKVLAEIFEVFKLPYSKTVTGARLANYVRVENQPLLGGLWDLTKSVFEA